RYYMPQADLSRSFRSCLEAIHSLNLFLRHALRSLLQSQVADKRKSRFPVWQTFPMLQEVDTVQSTFLRRRCSKIFHADSLRPAGETESAKLKRPRQPWRPLVQGSVWLRALHRRSVQCVRKTTSEVVSNHRCPFSRFLPASFVQQTDPPWKVSAEQCLSVS